MFSLEVVYIEIRRRGTGWGWWDLEYQCWSKPTVWETAEFAEQEANADGRVVVRRIVR